MGLFKDLVSMNNTNRWSDKLDYINLGKAI